ncbi:MAG: 3-deoxy-manno-octulosonate cytidylyltransferase [Deltaproteobacteria bacterium]|nr:3-deoxy-manno-octulosonate cytidylyltransferase [Deltaproteobacteria bacterium]
MKKRVAVVIPARFGSTRLPGKPLVDLGGKPLIARVIERAQKLPSAYRLYVAADDPRVAEAARLSGGEVVMTSELCQSGTDRVASAVHRVKCDLVVNLQGDEPLFPLEGVEGAVNLLENRRDLDMATVMTPLESLEEWKDRNVVKVVVDRQGAALFFSREPIPFSFDPLSEEDLRLLPVFRHVGIYVYRRERLLQFAETAQTPWEKSERLEQLRALELGWKIGTVKVDSAPRGIDTTEDLARLRLFFENH